VQASPAQSGCRPALQINRRPEPIPTAPIGEWSRPCTNSTRFRALDYIRAAMSSILVTLETRNDHVVGHSSLSPLDPRLPPPF
jgi:hypothetical protein